MSAMGYMFFWLSIASAVIMPFIYINAMQKIKDGDDSIILNKIGLGICSGIIMWTILMLILYS